jgi:hypothetical protein
LDESERCPDRALGLVLVRPGPAEIGEHTIAHELRDVPLEARDLARHRVLVGVQHVPHLLGIKPGRECRRSDEVDEHHRQLPALGLARPCGRGWEGRRRGRCLRARRGERLEEPLAVTECRDAELPEVFGGELPQDLNVDGVVAERLLVLLQAEAPEPSPDVHFFPLDPLGARLTRQATTIRDGTPR